MKQEVERLLELAAEVSGDARAEVLSRQSPDPAVGAAVSDLLQYADEAERCFDRAIQGAASSLIGRLEARAGDIVGGYRLVRQLAQGGMGRVYLAERADGEIEQRVAIKLLRADGLRKGWRERFLKERQLLASLQHPSIVHVIDAGHTDDGRPFLVMEHVDGVPIDTYAAGIPVRERLRIFVQVCEGVSYAHRRLIIHRDLKPSNILVDASGRPKLLDFGIAKLLNETGDLTQAAEQMLTPNYASPEQLRGEAQSTATDVYSLAAVLHKLLMGRAPRERAAETIDGEKSTPARGQDKVPGDLDYVLAKALRPEPEERYGTVDEFANDVRAVLKGRPVQARGADFWYRARRYLRRYWIPVAAAAAVMASLSAGLELANRERQNAERRFTDVRQLANKLFDIDVQVAQLPGSSKTRQLIVDTALQYLRRVSSEVRVEPDLALELGTAYMRVARVQGVNTSPNLGETAQADQTAITAERLIDSVLAAQPGNRIALLRAGQIAHDRMILAASSSQQEQVLQFARISIDRISQFLAARRLDAVADHADAQQAIIALMNIANQYMKAGWFDQALQTAQRAIDLAQATNWPTQAGAALMIVAQSHRAAGDLDGALTAIRESVRLLEPEKGETRFGRLQAFGLALIREGQILGEDEAISLRRPAEAIPFFERGLRIGEEFANRDANDFASQYRLFFVEGKLANILRHNDPARALALYDDALQRVSHLNANDATLQDEAATLSASVYPLLRLKRTGKARQRLDAALECLRKVKQYPAERIEAGSAADLTLRALAEYEASTEGAEKGVARYEELLHAVMASRPKPDSRLEDAVEMGELYGAGARFARLARRDDLAADWEGRRQKLWQSWIAKLPNNSFVRSQLDAAH